MAFKDVGPICQLKVRLQENPDGSYFDGWSFDQVHSLGAMVFPWEFREDFCRLAWKC